MRKIIEMEHLVMYRFTDTYDFANNKNTVKEFAIKLIDTPKYK